ncbi:MAG: tail fiber domain-containing protein, partial [Ferruginibacter sp.]
NQALNANISGNSNTANGTIALALNTTGIANTGFGSAALHNNVTGSYNTALGFFADVSFSNLTAATAIGSYANAHCSNCLTLGGTGPYHAYVGINNPTPLTDLHIIQYTDGGADKLRGIRLQRSVNTNHWRTLIDPSNNYVFEYNDNLYTYINPTTGAYINPSDMRLKKDVAPLESIIGKVMALAPKKFHYKTNSADDPLLWGFIAQDVQKVFPEFVTTKDDGYLGMAYTNFSVVAIKAIQEQQAIIEKQQKQIDKMQKQIELLLNSK